MTIDDAFYVKIGRMTVACGELDFMVEFLTRNMAAMLAEDEPSVFTARQLDEIKSMARNHEERLGKEQADELVNLAGAVKGFLRRRQGAIHGLWLQEGDADSAWSMMIPKGGLMGAPTKTDAATLDDLAAEAQALQRRVSQAVVPILKLS